MKNMKNIMMVAWEIYRTLEGDHMAKLSQALRTAWAEARKAAKPVKKVEFTLPELVGTPKQIAWAEDIRKTFVSNWTEYLTSDDVFFKGDILKRTAFEHAERFFKSGITEGSCDRRDTRFHELYRIAMEEKGMKAKEADKWVFPQHPMRQRWVLDSTLVEKYTRGEISAKLPECTASSGLDDVKELLRQCLEYALLREPKAADWIDEYKYCKGANIR